MGYSTIFKGKLSFKTKLSDGQIAALNEILGEDCREHPEWDAPDLTYIDLQFTTDPTGLEWDGSEKTYDLEKKVNVVVKEMQRRWPEFGLTGCLVAQGEDYDDKWLLVMEDDGLAHKVIEGSGIPSRQATDSSKLPQLMDDSKLPKIVDNVIAKFPRLVIDYQKALGFLIKEVIRDTKGTENLALVHKVLVEKLHKAVTNIHQNAKEKI